MAPLAQICEAFKKRFSYSNFTNTLTDNRGKTGGHLWVACNCQHNLRTQDKPSQISQKPFRSGEGQSEK